MVPSCSHDAVPGLCIRRNFLSPVQHESFINYINEQSGWVPFGRKRRIPFGGHYNVSTKLITSTWGHFRQFSTTARCDWRKWGLMGEVADQVVVTEYLPGQGIGEHIDKEDQFGEFVVSVSLAPDSVPQVSGSSGVAMVFRDRRLGLKDEIYLEPGSALSLFGPARWEWTHEIPARLCDSVDGVTIPRQRRWSITFRRMTGSATHCQFK